MEGIYVNEQFQWKSYGVSIPIERMTNFERMRLQEYIDESAEVQEETLAQLLAPGLFEVIANAYKETPAGNLFKKWIKNK